jgi:putative membrane fusion protein
VDGAEAALGTDKLSELDKSDLETYSARKAVETPVRSCTKGEPVFKVVNNSKWYLVFYLDNAKAEKYHEGSYVSIDVNGEAVRVQVSGVYKGDDTAKIILKCKSFFDGFLEERKLDTTVTVASAEGLMLHDSSIVKNAEGQKGVFIKNKIGKHLFRPISAKADDGENCVVYSDIYVDENGNFVETIRTYDEIVEQPTDEDLKSIGAVIKEDKADDQSSEEGDKK